MGMLLVMLGRGKLASNSGIGAATQRRGRARRACSLIVLEDLRAQLRVDIVQQQIVANRLKLPAADLLL